MEGATATATATATSNNIPHASVTAAPYRGPGCGQGAGGNAGPAGAVESPVSDGLHDTDKVVAAKGKEAWLSTVFSAATSAGKPVEGGRLKRYGSPFETVFWITQLIKMETFIDMIIN